MKDYAKLREERVATLPPEVAKYFGAGMASRRPSCRSLGVDGMRALMRSYFGDIDRDPESTTKTLRFPARTAPFPPASIGPNTWTTAHIRFISTFMAAAMSGSAKWTLQ